MAGMSCSRPSANTLATSSVEPCEIVPKVEATKSTAPLGAPQAAASIASGTDSSAVDVADDIDEVDDVGRVASLRAISRMAVESAPASSIAARYKSKCEVQPPS